MRQVEVKLHAILTAVPEDDKRRAPAALFQDSRKCLRRLSRRIRSIYHAFSNVTERTQTFSLILQPEV